MSNPIDEEDEPDPMAEYFPHRSLMPVLTADDGKTRIPINALLRLDPNNMVLEFQVHSAWQATISYQCGLAELAVTLAEKEHDKIEAQLFLRHRQAASGPAGKAPSVDVVKSLVITDDDYQKSLDTVMLAKRQLVAWKSANQAMFARRECLISMGAEVRLDRKSSPS